MSLQDLQEQAFKLSIHERFVLMDALVESLQI